MIPDMILMILIIPLRFSLLSTAMMLVKCMMGSSTSRYCCLQGSLTLSSLFWWVFCRRTSTDALGPSLTLWVCYIKKIVSDVPMVSQTRNKPCLRERMFSKDYSIRRSCSHYAYCLFGRSHYLKQHNHCENLLEFQAVLLSESQFLIGGMENVNTTIYSIHV